MAADYNYNQLFNEGEQRLFALAENPMNVNPSDWRDFVEKFKNVATYEKSDFEIIAKAVHGELDIETCLATINESLYFLVQEYDAAMVVAMVIGIINIDIRISLDYLNDLKVSLSREYIESNYLFSEKIKQYIETAHKLIIQVLEKYKVLQTISELSI